MTPEQHAKIKAIFIEACGLPPDQQAAFVNSACGDDAALRRHVERLLSNHLPNRASNASTVDLAAARREEDLQFITELPDFSTGDVVAERYRIVSRLGEGGMGRVYRAEDMRLHQTVALKFLPRLHMLDPSWRGRVEREVKLAREVAHPHVCRLYDLGEIDGLPCISMEYVDGEDLGSLLRRVGRVTGQRAIDLARQICAGLAAAHVHGVLHRDLKPANVMIDGKGLARLTDFGLAVQIGQVDRAEIRAGTPRYMAPEQLAGIEVSERSDLYSVGLVLYELFTGQPAFTADNPAQYLKLHRTEDPPEPSKIVSTIDPQVEAVILACMAKDPAKRPPSALHVAAALPGGDLLASAIDAGQIPTREMLAAAAAVGSIRPRAVPWLAAGAVVLFVLAVLIGRGSHPIAQHGGALAPDILRERAREVIRGAGYPSIQTECEGRFVFAGDLDAPQGEPVRNGWIHALPHYSVTSLLYVYREWKPTGTTNVSVRFPFVSSSRSIIACEAPAGGMIVVLDGRGRLLHFESRRAASPENSASESPPDWAAIAKLSTLPSAAFAQHAADASTAGMTAGSRDWVQVQGTDAADELLVQLKSSAGQLRYFTLCPANANGVGDATSSDSRRRLASLGRNGVFLLLLFAALPAAWRNLKRRGDVGGAVRLGATVVLLRLTGQLLSIQSVADGPASVEKITTAVASSLCEGAILAIFYLALECAARRYWPRVLGSWSRLLAGHVRDPIVGRDVLIGCVVGAFWGLLVMVDRQLPIWLGWSAREQARLARGLDSLLGARFALDGALDSVISGLYQGLTALMLLVVFKWLVGRKTWLIMGLTWCLATVMYAPNATHPFTAWTLMAIGGVGVAVVVLMRFGLVTLLTGLLLVGMIGTFPILLDAGSWYAGYGLFSATITLGLIAWSAYESLRSPTFIGQDSPPA